MSQLDFAQGGPFSAPRESAIVSILLGESFSTPRFILAFGVLKVRVY
jgi:hypothetical protein